MRDAMDERYAAAVARSIKKGAHSMRRRVVYVLVAVSIVASLAAVASAAAKKPKPHGYYASKSPELSITVGKPAKTVTLYVGCMESSTMVWWWDSPTIRLKHNSFSFDRRTTIGIESGAGFTHPKATVMFTGKFKDGKWRGSVQIGGAPCPEHSYTAKYDKNGGGGSGK
jgi:hypothetical protein